MSISTNVQLVCEWHIFLQYYTVTIGETESVFVLLKGAFVKNGVITGMNLAHGRNNAIGKQLVHVG